ncbi:hypothetical protein [Thiolapillus sp.]|uniref:hypothetical protein n=1 Tax=Thiolapillus sp. TaxID=2017437 RepID=UPI003AF984D5
MKNETVEYNPVNTYHLENVKVINDTHPRHDQVDDVLALGHSEHGAVGWVTVFFNDDDEWAGAVGEREELRQLIPTATQGFYKIGTCLGDKDAWPNKPIVEAFALSSKCENLSPPLYELASDLDEHGSEYVIAVLEEVNKLRDLIDPSRIGCEESPKCLGEINQLKDLIDPDFD